MKRVRKYFTLLQAVRVADPKTRVAIVRHAPDEFVKTLIEIVLNFLKGNLRVSNAVKGRLRKRKTQLRRIATYKGKIGVQKARKDLVQRGGLPFLIPLIAGLAALGGVGGGVGIAAAAAPSIARNAARSATNSALDTVAERAKTMINKL